jgi:6-phospho-beta-glucosidase
MVAGDGTRDPTRVVIIGGSAPSTPNLLIDSRFGVDSGVRFVLFGRSVDRLEAVRRAAVLLAPSLDGAIETTTDLDAALEGATFVVIQIRVGGFAARIHDELFPLAAGIPGDEGLGPGGLAAAWRTWPILREILGKIATRCPHARVALLTAPLGILTRCAQDAFPGLQIAGLCELPAVALQQIASAVHERHLQYDYVGVNHLGWFTRIQKPDGTDMLDAYAATCNETVFPTTSIIRRLSAVPLSYVRLHEARADVVEKQRASPPRGRAVGALAADALQAYSAGNREEVRRALAARHAPWYQQAVAPWIDAYRLGNSSATFFLTSRNERYLSNLDANAVLEIPHRMRDGSFYAIPSPAGVPKAIAETLQSLVTYETLAATAVTARNERRLANVLSAHPWVGDASTAAALVDGVVATV